MRSGRAVYFDEEDEEDEDGGVGGVGVGVVDCSGKNEAILLLSVIMNDECSFVKCWTTFSVCLWSFSLLSRLNSVESARSVIFCTFSCILCSFILASLIYYSMTASIADLIAKDFSVLLIVSSCV